MKLYHVSDRSNLESILEKGILRGEGSSYVSLSERYDSWVRPEGDSTKVIFEVEGATLPGRMNSFLPELDEIIHWGDVPRENILRWRIGNLRSPYQGWISTNGGNISRGENA